MRAPIDPRLVRRADATKVYLLTGVAAGTATAVLVLLQAQLLSRSIATVFERHSLAGLTASLVGLAAVLAGRGLLGWLNAWSSQRAAAAVKSQLRQDIMAARLERPTGSTTASSALVTLVTQGLDALDGYFSKYLPQLLLAVTVPLILGVAILTRDLGSAVIIAATIPFIPLLMALVGIKTQESVEKRWRFQTRLANHFADLVAGLPTLQVFSRARAQAAGLRRTEAANRRATMGILKISFLSALVLELFSTLAVAVVAVTIGTRLCAGGMDFQTALFVLILAPEVYLPIRQVGVHYHDSADGLAAAEAAFAEIDGLAEATPGQSSPKQSSSGRPAPDQSLPGQSSLGQSPSEQSAPERLAPERLAASGTPPTGADGPLDGGGETPAESGTPSAGADAQAAGADLSTTGVGASPPPAAARTAEAGPRPVRADAPPDGSDGRPAGTAAADASATPLTPRFDTIRARGQGYSYPGAAGPALAAVDLDLGPGQVVALAGRSGGGKTTLLNLVLGFLTPTAGRLELG
ncbi:MAG: ATP-binding cassette domain-containing protein, partial [Propionibacteriaceae bacterium]|nr:ATP-binding cassette domain-containing protein [Propionibacteriaceae bacterium]